MIGFMRVAVVVAAWAFCLLCAYLIPSTLAVPFTGPSYTHAATDTDTGAGVHGVYRQVATPAALAAVGDGEGTMATMRQAETNATSVRLVLNQAREFELPSLASGARFVLRVEAQQPLPSPSASGVPLSSPPSSSSSSPSTSSPSVPSSSPVPVSTLPGTTLVVDLEAAFPHSLILSAVEDEPPLPCTLQSGSAPESACFPDASDYAAWATRSSRAFVYLRGVSASSPVFLVVTNVGDGTAPNLKLNAVRVSHDPNNPHAVCPGSASNQRCLDRGRCDDASARCSCPPDWGGAACHVAVQQLPSPTAQPSWLGAVEPLRDSALFDIPLAGVVVRVSPPGPRSRISVRARVLFGAVSDDPNGNGDDDGNGGEDNGKVISVDGGSARLDMVCKARGANEGDGLEYGTDIPTLYDTQAMGTIVSQPDADAEGGATHDLLCVSKEDVAPGDEWLVAFIARADAAPGGAGGAGEAQTRAAAVSVLATRCGGKDMPECPLGVHARTVSLRTWMIIGIAVVLGVIALVACVFWGCRSTLGHAIPTGGSGDRILDGRVYQVVDYGKPAAAVPVQADKVFALGAASAVDEEEEDDDDDDRAYKRESSSAATTSDATGGPRSRRVPCNNSNAEGPHRSGDAERERERPPHFDLDSIWRFERHRRRQRVDRLSRERDRASSRSQAPAPLLTTPHSPAHATLDPPTDGRPRDSDHNPPPVDMELR